MGTVAVVSAPAIKIAASGETANVVSDGSSFTT